MSPELQAALVRAALTALGAGVLAFLTDYATTNDWKRSLAVGIAAALGALGINPVAAKTQSAMQARAAR